MGEEAFNDFLGEIEELQTKLGEEEQAALSGGSIAPPKSEVASEGENITKVVSEPKLKRTTRGSFIEVAPSFSTVIAVCDNFNARSCEDGDLMNQ